MRNLGLKILLGWVLFLPITAYSLGLGEIDVRSFLNQPLKAEIAVISTRPGEVDDLIVGLASRDAFTRASISRPSHLNELKFKVNKSDDGLSATISVSTVLAMKEPVLNFLVEADWAKGKMFREFTVLLDPPYFAQQANSSSNPQPPSRNRSLSEPSTSLPNESAPVVKNNQQNDNVTQQTAIYTLPDEAEVSKNTRQINPSDVRANQTDNNKQATTAAKSSSVANPKSPPKQQRPVKSTVNQNISKDELLVTEGATLWSLARTIKTEGVSMSQVMLALQRANTNSFGQDNINSLKTGAILRVPSKQEMTTISGKDAYAEVLEQNGLWNDYLLSTGSPKAIRTVSNTQNTSASSNTAGKQTSPTVKENVKSASKLSILTANDGDSDNASLRSDNTDQVSSLRKQLLLSEEETESLKEENNELATRLRLLEEELAKNNELLDLMAVESDSMAALQQNVQAQQQVSITENENNVDLENESQVSNAQSNTNNGQNLENSTVTKNNNNETQVKETPIIETPVIQTPIIVSESKSSFDIVGFIMSNLTLIGGAFFAILLAIAGLLFVKKRKNSEDEEISELDDEIIDVGDDLIHVDLEDSSDAEADSSNEYAATVTALKSDDAEVEDEFSSTAIINAGEMSEITEESAELNQTQVEEPAEVFEQDETLDEVDVYLAYSLYDNAEELLKEKLVQYPDRADYRAKLLDTYFATQDKVSFENEAKELFNLGDDAKRYWKRVQTMGYELDPTNSMFADGQGGDLAEIAIAKPDSADFDIGFQDDDLSEFDMSFTAADLNSSSASTVATAGVAAAGSVVAGSIAASSLDENDSLNELDADATADDLESLEFDLSEFETSSEDEDNFDLTDDADGFSVASDTQEFSVDDVDIQSVEPEDRMSLDFDDSDLNLESGNEAETVKDESLEIDLSEFEVPDDDEVNISLDDIESQVASDVDDLDISIAPEIDADDEDNFPPNLDFESFSNDENGFSDTLNFPAYEEEPVDNEASGSDTSQEEELELDIGSSSELASNQEDSTHEDLDLGDFEGSLETRIDHLDQFSLEEQSTENKDFETALNSDNTEDSLDIDMFDLDINESDDNNFTNVIENDLDIEDLTDFSAMDVEIDLEDAEVPPVIDAEIDLQDTVVLPPSNEESDKTEVINTIDKTEVINALDISDIELSEIESEFAEENQLSEDDLSMTDIENLEGLMLPDDVDEVATKLDLAKAYQDMGDFEGARDNLEEVIAEGNSEQKKEATALLDKLAG